MPYIKSSDWHDIQERLRKVSESGNTQLKETFTGLKRAIERDVKAFSQNEIANAMLNELCIKFGCRESAYVMEEGRSINVQPFRLTDGTYKVVSRNMLQRILRETKVDAIEWQSDSYDCEDIARKFATRCADLGINSVGRVMSWSGRHAFCIAVVQSGDGVAFEFIEPQTDEFIEVLEGKYDLSNALIVIS